MSGPIGLVANPASGKDVRRLVARASVFDNQEKQAIVRRALLGAAEAGATQLRYLADRHGIVEQALKELKLKRKLNAKAVDATAMSSAIDTISAARAMADADCAVVMTLGGDGTNRAFCLGWPDACLIPISTGTNNVFPNLGEATIAGAAAGLISSGALNAAAVSRRHKVIHVEIEDERDDLALIDAVLSSETHVGARALLEADAVREVLLTRADPAAVGMTCIGGLLKPVSDDDDYGLRVQLVPKATAKAQTPICTLRAPIAPGYYQSLKVRSARRQGLERTITWQGPGVLAFDGERERVLGTGQKVRLTLRRDGPRVIDVAKTLALAAEKGCFRR